MGASRKPASGRLPVKLLVPSYNRYSHHARRALTHAAQLVTRLHHPIADTGHLLLGVMQTRGCIGAQVLYDLDLNFDVALDTLRSLSPVMPKPPPEVRNADDLNAALAQAADEAAWLGHHYIGTEHLLLGITRNNVGNAHALLRSLNIAPEQVRCRIRNLASDGAREPDLQSAKRTALLTELSRRTINAAEQMAVALDHPLVGLGHLLLVMLLEERSLTSSFLREAGLDEGALRGRLDGLDAPLLVSIETVLNRVADQAESLGSHYTGTEHLLFTMATDEAGYALLSDFRVDPDALCERIKTHLQVDTRR